MIAITDQQNQTFEFKVLALLEDSPVSDWTHAFHNNYESETLTHNTGLVLRRTRVIDEINSNYMTTKDNTKIYDNASIFYYYLEYGNYSQGVSWVNKHHFLVAFENLRTRIMDSLQEKLYSLV